MRRSILALGLLAASLIGVTAFEVSPASAASDTAARRYVGDGVHADAAGWYAANSTSPKVLVVFAHHCCKAMGAADAGRDYVAEVASTARVPVLAVAPDYRGDGTWNVRAGVEDVVNLVDGLRQWFRFDRVIYHGFSMGSLVATTAAAERPDLVDHLVWGNGIGDYPAATQATQFAAEYVHADMGGKTPAQDPALYKAYSPVHRADDLRALDRVWVLGNPKDPMISYLEATKFAASLLEHGVSRTLYGSTSYLHSVDGIAGQLEGVVMPLTAGRTPTLL